jgi:hypothetical protein
MRKSLATICLLFGLTLVLPIFVSAANEVQFTEDTNLYIADSDVTVVAEDSSAVDSISIDSDSIDITMSPATNGITLTSADKYILSNTWNVETFCRENNSYLAIRSPSSTSTVTVTLGSLCAGVQETGGGGGGAEEEVSPEVTPPTTPVAQMTVEQLKAEITRITNLLIQLITSLIAQLQAELGAL